MIHKSTDHAAGPRGSAPCKAKIKSNKRLFEKKKRKKKKSHYQLANRRSAFMLGKGEFPGHIIIKFLLKNNSAIR